MASERYFLIDTTSGLGIMLGKHMNAGIYKTTEHLAEFFSYIGVWGQDDLYLFQETKDVNWVYGEPKGIFRQFIWDGSEEDNPIERTLLEE